VNAPSLKSAVLATTVLITIGSALAFTRTLPTSEGMDAEDALMVFIAVIAITVVAGGIVVMHHWEAKTAREDLQRAHLSATLLTGGFRAIAVRMGLEDPWPGRRADEVPEPGPYGFGFTSPALRGTYRNRRINVMVCGSRSSDDDSPGGHFDVIVRARRGSPWRKLGRVDWGKPPAELFPPALLALERLKERKKRGRQIRSIRVDAEELLCVTRDDITGAISLEEARTDTALPEPTELEAILDDLVTLADGLPVVNAPGDRSRSG
jgi:hypothetical protein